MTRNDKDPTKWWTGVLGAPGTISWMHEGLAREEVVDAFNAPKDAKPVSVRLAPATIAVLDAFAQRFGLTRSGMLLQLIEGGLAEAFHGLPEKEQGPMLRLASAKAADAGWDIQLGPTPRPVYRRVEKPTPLEDEL